MTENNNGWPARPGVPLHPERDGWHWVARPMKGTMPVLWLEVAGGGWVGNHTCLFALEAHKAGWRYLGPSLTPTEVAAALADARAQGRREGLEEAARVMNKLTATWPHVGPVPCRVQGEWGLRDKVLPAIRALAQGGKP